MTTTFDPEVERFLSGPAPYGSGNPVPAERPRYRTAEQELADALEGQAPRLAHDVAELLGPARTARLAQTVRRAVAVGIRRRAEQETAERVAGMYDLLVDGLNQITECTTSEDEQPAARCDHSESLYGRCVSCGMTWQEQQAVRRGEG